RVCGDYGKLIDVYIPNTRSKSGKRYGFVRFVKITEVDRLIENPYTIWMARLRLHVNVVRFQRPSLNYVRKDVSINVGKRPSHVKPWSFGFSGKPNSYAFAVKQGKLDKKVEEETKHVLVLDELCILERDFSLSLMGKLKDFDSISNIKKTRNTFTIIASKWGELLQEDQEDACFHSWAPDFVKEDEDENEMDDDNLEEDLNEVNDELRKEEIVEDVTDDEEIPKTFFDQEDLDSSKKEPHCDRQDDAHSSDPFNLYDLLKKKKKHDDGNGDQLSEDTLKFPPGFTRKDDTNVYSKSLNKSEGVFEEGMNEVDSDVREKVSMQRSKEETHGSTCSGHFKKLEFTRSGGSILNLMDELVKAKKDWVEELCVNYKVNFLSIQETKMENVEIFNIKMCWGNFAFDFVHSLSVGKSGGILCVWDPRLFRKTSSTISDYFVILRGDFNEVSTQDERYGSVFNVQGADAFNLFISSFGLVEVPLDGCSFTWCHKSASKMSKIDRFLISKGLMESCLNISSITLDRYLSDHRPILLRESSFDYGPILLCFFHSWFIKKLKNLKEKTRSWIKVKNDISKTYKRSLKGKLAGIEALIDKGDANSDILNQRMHVVKSLQDLDKLESLEVTQKAKIKWSIEGDKNSKYYHGILNKKISQLAIRGILVDRVWVDSPSLRVVDAGLFKGVIIGASLQLSHLYYANDVVFIEYNVKKPMWVKLNNVLPSKEKGGLGVLSFYTLNRALMFKWVWRFHNQGSSLWARVIKVVHGEDVGNRAETLFWEDVWRGDVAFKMLYPRVYSLETVKNISVTFKLSHEDMGSSLHRSPKGGAEQAQFFDMCAKVEGTFIAVMRDRWMWMLDGSGEFSVASVRRLLDDSLLPEVSSKTQWINAVPIKVNVHAWKVRLDCLPTRINISCKGIEINFILCPNCGKAAESTSHIFFGCSMVRELYRKITFWWDCSFVELSSFEEWVEWISNLRMQANLKRLLKGVCYIMWWFVWSFRNKTLFGLGCPLKMALFDDIVTRLFNWCRFRCKASFSWVDWLKSPYLVSL
nr:RNA-directed DNA polymerase, eukaryota, reverse transcriptase zinc-binding domain protein [Tanacetum cinerariifolium]